MRGLRYSKRMGIKSFSFEKKKVIFRDKQSFTIGTINETFFLGFFGRILNKNSSNKMHKSFLENSMRKRNSDNLINYSKAKV